MTLGSWVIFTVRWILLLAMLVIKRVLMFNQNLWLISMGSRDGCRIRKYMRL